MGHEGWAVVKIGASGRAAASLFAMQYGPLSDEHLAPAWPTQRWGNCLMRLGGLRRYFPSGKSKDDESRQS